MAIDEAAAIPLPTVKKLLGPYLVFMSSTGKWERERERERETLNRLLREI